MNNENDVRIFDTGCKGMFFIKQTKYDFMFNVPSLSSRYNIKVEWDKDIKNIVLNYAANVITFSLIYDEIKLKYPLMESFNFTEREYSIEYRKANVNHTYKLSVIFEGDEGMIYYDTKKHRLIETHIGELSSSLKNGRYDNVLGI